MAGWDHAIDVDPRDEDLLLRCFKLLRRTCARHRVEFTYHRDRSFRGTRLRYYCVYNLQSVNMPPAVAEFAIEMRALSTLESERRRKRLPLRLLRDVAWESVYSAADQLLEVDSREFDTAKLDDLELLLVALESSWYSWHVESLSDGDFLESQHSFVTGLALLMAEDAETRDNYPTLVEKLQLDAQTESALKQLGARRREVKHLGNQEHAREYAEESLPWVLRLVYSRTGVNLDPIGPLVAALATEPAVAFDPPPMFWRSGEPRTVRR